MGAFMIKRLTLLGTALAVLLTMLAAFAGAAQADGTSGYHVTFVALKCASYEDVYANRARNNIMESLADLGPDSQYSGADVVNPVQESLAPQDKCRPIKDWKFTMGTGIEARAVTGAWGAMSKVTSPYDTSIVTKSSVPELDDLGNPIAGRSIDGAVNIELTDEQAKRAQSSSSLWVQGGVPDDPVLAKEYGGVNTPEYGFATLRCATDATNADNVEWIFFPNNTRHVYCYAIYVVPPPTSGTIIVKKVVDGAPAGTDQKFEFTGNISYDPGGFQLGNGESATFYRGESGVSGDWDFTESKSDDYTLTKIDCTSKNSTSSFNTSLPDRKTVVTLAAGDTVTCTYTNKFNPPAGLSIFEQTQGGTGSFDYTVKRLATGYTESLHAKTDHEDVAVKATGQDQYKPGEYRIDGGPAASETDEWDLVSIDCDGTKHDSAPFDVELKSGEHLVCLFVHRLRPPGAISLSKTTLGGVGTANFEIVSVDQPAQIYRHNVTTEFDGVTAHAKPDTDSDATDHVPLGAYTITEQQPLFGNWQLLAVECDRLSQPFSGGTVKVELTREKPVTHCEFTDMKVKHPPNPGNGEADLSIKKTVAEKTVIHGHNAYYTLTVRNLGPDTAENVVVTDQVIDHSAVVVSVHNPTGLGCRIVGTISCRLGTMKRGAKIELRVVLSTDGWHGVIKNRGVVGSTTHDPRLSNNISYAVVHVIPAPLPPITGGEG